jgi:hypothetical protein
VNKTAQTVKQTVIKTGLIKTTVRSSPVPKVARLALTPQSKARGPLEALEGDKKRGH